MLRNIRPARIPLMVLGATAAATAVMLNAVVPRLTELGRQVSAAQADVQNLRLKTTANEEALARLHRDLPAYRMLEHSGFVAPNDRLPLRLALRDVRDIARLSSLDYRIGARRTLPAPPHSAASRLALHETPVQFKAALLHEEELLRLLVALDERLSGLYRLEECMLKRLPTSGTSSFAANLEAACRLVTFSVSTAEAGG